MLDYYQVNRWLPIFAFVLLWAVVKIFPEGGGRANAERRDDAKTSNKARSVATTVLFRPFLGKSVTCIIWQGSHGPLVL